MLTIEKYSLVVIREFIAANWDAFVDYAKENEVDPEIIYQQIDGRESAVELTYDVLGMIGHYVKFPFMYSGVAANEVRPSFEASISFRSFA